MARLAELLQRRSPVVHVMRPESRVADAIAIMAEQRIGAVPIVERSRLVGIFSERDLLRRVVARGLSVETTTLREVMTPDPVTASPEEGRREAVLKMQRVGCRHLPVLAGNEVIDMLSMRDLLFSEIEEQTAQIDDLKRYISGSY